MKILKLNPSKPFPNPSLDRAGKEKNGFSKIIKETAEVIKNGGLVVFPSDTVYILAVDPTNKKAVKKLLAFKNRWTGKAISVAVFDKNMAEEYVELTEIAQNIYANLLPGPFTIVSKGKHKIAPGIEAENGTLGIRIPDNKYIHDLIKILKKPITATSANLSGRTPNYSIASFLRPLSKRKEEMIDLIVDVGKLPRNRPSTVIDATEAELKILRRGDLTTGNNVETLISKSEKETGKIAEFLLKKYFKQVETLRATSLQQKPIVFCLSGDLGCGKTVFSRKIGHLLGVKEKITSPTFVIYNEYSISNPSKSPFDLKGDLKTFLHFDLYRISTDYEFKEIKFLELFTPNSVSCIEWPENMGKKNFDWLKKNTNLISINFEYVDENTREIRY